MAQALVPLKDLVLAKTRLSGVLTSVERRALAQAMVEDVLDVLSNSESFPLIFSPAYLRGEQFTSLCA